MPAGLWTWSADAKKSHGGDCAVGGRYFDGSFSHAFVLTERNGRWGRARHFFPAKDKNGHVEVSCTSAGNCSASWKTFVASEQGGRWGKVIEVPGIPPPSSGICGPNSPNCVSGQVASESCAPGGACAAGGSYDTSHIAGERAFVTSYTNGRWTKIIRIPGLKALDTRTFSEVTSVSCTPAGICVAGGSYATTKPRTSPAFVVEEKNGTWGRVHTVLFRS